MLRNTSEGEKKNEEEKKKKKLQHIYLYKWYGVTEFNRAGHGTTRTRVDRAMGEGEGPGGKNWNSSVFNVYTALHCLSNKQN